MSDIQRRWARAQEIITGARSENRPMNEAERAEYDGLITAIDEERHNAVGASLSQVVRTGIDGRSAPPTAGDGGQRSPTGAPVNVRDAVLTREQRFTDWARAHGQIPEDYDEEVRREGPLRLGSMIRGVLTGEWRGAERELRALGSSPGSAGGYMLPTAVSAEIIDALRQRTAVFNAGARIVPMATQEMTLAKVTSPATASWRGEGTLITSTDPTLGSVRLSAKMAVALIKANRELLMDAPNADDMIVRELTAACGIALDEAGLRGSGAANEPMGIDAYTADDGINEVSAGVSGATADWDDVLDVLTAIRTDNGPEPTAAIWHPRTAGAFGKLKDSQNRYLTPPTGLDGLTYHSTTGVRIDETQGTAENASRIYIADFSEMLIGVRNELTIVPVSERYIDNFQVGFFAFLRADVALAHTESFGRLIGIIP